MYTLSFMVIAGGWVNGDVTYIFDNTLRMMQFLLPFSMTKIDMTTFNMLNDRIVNFKN